MHGWTTRYVTSSPNNYIHRYSSQVRRQKQLEVEDASYAVPEPLNEYITLEAYRRVSTKYLEALSLLFLLSTGVWVYWVAQIRSTWPILLQFGLHRLCLLRFKRVSILPEIDRNVYTTVYQYNDCICQRRSTGCMRVMRGSIKNEVRWAGNRARVHGIFDAAICRLLSAQCRLHCL